VLSSHSAVGLFHCSRKLICVPQYIGGAHFGNDINFIDIFLPGQFSSESRCKALLWLCYHYLESAAIDLDDYGNSDVGSGNPFCDPERPGKAPAFVRLTKEQALLENIDTASEKQLVEKLVAERKQKQSLQAKTLTGEDADSVGSQPESRPKPKRLPKTEKEREALILRKEILKQQALEELAKERAMKEDAVQRARASSPEVARYAKRPRRTLLQRENTLLCCFILNFTDAWHVVTTSDPLLDSDEDQGTEVDRFDYAQRLKIVSRLRGKEPTPEPERRPVERRAYRFMPSQ
jgi:Ino eighty subunit 1